MASSTPSQQIQRSNTEDPNDFVIQRLDSQQANKPFFQNPLHTLGNDLLDRLQFHTLLVVFGIFDTDNSGQIDISKIENALKRMGFPFDKQKVQKVIDSIDIINGFIDFNGFVQLMTKIRVKSEKMFELKMLFQHIDTKQDGSIDAEELMQMFKSIGFKINTEEIQDMLKVINKTGDGNILFKEFVDFFYDIF